MGDRGAVVIRSVMFHISAALAGTFLVGCVWLLSIWSDEVPPCEDIHLRSAMMIAASEAERWGDCAIVTRERYLVTVRLVVNTDCPFDGDVKPFVFDLTPPKPSGSIRTDCR